MSRIYNIPKSIGELVFQLEELDSLVLEILPFENYDIPNQVLCGMKTEAQRAFGRAKEEYRKKLVRKIRYRAQKLNETR